MRIKKRLNKLLKKLKKVNWRKAASKIFWIVIQALISQLVAAVIKSLVELSYQFKASYRINEEAFL